MGIFEKGWENPSPIQEVINMIYLYETNINLILILFQIQIRQVFLLHATMTGLIENAFIPVHIFKHQFYPGFKWKPEYNKNQVDKKN